MTAPPAREAGHGRVKESLVAQCLVILVTVCLKCLVILVTTEIRDPSPPRTHTLF